MIAIYLLLGVVILALEFRRQTGGASIDGLTIFNAYYFILYVFVPINVIVFGEVVVRQKYAFERFGYGDWWTALALLLTYMLFYLGHSLASLSEKGRDTISSQLELNSLFDLKKIINVAVIMFVVATAALAINAMQLGGFTDTICKAALTRAGQFTSDSDFVFIRHFMSFSAAMFMLLSAVLMWKKNTGLQPTLLEKCLFAISFVLFIYYGFVSSGRRELILPLLIVFLVYISIVRCPKIKIVIPFFLVCFVVAGGGARYLVAPLCDATTANVIFTDEYGQMGAYGRASRGLGDSFMHFVAAQHAELWQFGFLTDIKYLPEDLLPSRLLGFERSRHMYGETTTFINGKPLGEGLSGEEPLSLHGYILVNFGYVGMFVIFTVFGYLYHKLHYKFCPVNSGDAVSWLIYWWVIIGCFVLFREGAVILVIKGHMVWWLSIILLMAMARNNSIPGAKKRWIKE